DREVRSGLIERLTGCRSLAQPVAEDVGHDREQPGLFVRARLETISVAVGSQIRFLHQVLGVLWLPREAQRAPIERVDMPLKKRKVATHANASLVHSIPTNSSRRPVLEERPAAGRDRGPDLDDGAGDSNPVGDAPVPLGGGVGFPILPPPFWGRVGGGGWADAPA